MNTLTRFAATAALAATSLGVPAYASHEAGWTYARVVRAEPIVRHVRVSEPRRECTEEPVRERVVYPGRPDPGAVLVGGIIGGVIGHQFGGGHGRDVATAAGAVIGAHAGAAHTWRNGREVERTVYETTCTTHYAQRRVERVEGYDVTYRYRGRLYHTRMPYDPGKRVRVRMDVAPADYDGYR